MLPEPKNSDAIIVTSQNFELYQKLMQQLSKDFTYANIELPINENTPPQAIKQILHETVYNLIQNRFTEYLNLLYIIDVSEEKIKQLDGSDIVKLAEQVAYLILKREWEKVWFRHHYS